MTVSRTRREVLTRGGVGLAAGVLALGRPSIAAASASTTRYDVRDFGAVGDGVTDDTPAIQAAIAAATEGGTVWLPVPPGFQPYVVSTLRMRDRVRLQGETPNVTIRKLAGSSGPVVCADQTRGRGGFATSFRDLVIDGNAAACPLGTDGLGQHPDDPDGEGYHGDAVQIESVMFQSCRRHGVSLGHSRSNTTLPVLRNVRSTYNLGKGVVLHSINDGWFDIGWVAENGAGGILIETCGALRLRAIQIEGNDDPVASGWMRDERPGLEIVGSRLVFVQGGCTFSSTRTALVVSGHTTDVDISGNWFNGNNSHGQPGVHPTVRVDAGAARISGVVIRDNTFDDIDRALVGGDGTSTVSHHVEIVAPTSGSYEGVRVAANTMRFGPSNPAGEAIVGPAEGVLLAPVAAAATTVLHASVAWVSATAAVSFTRRVVDPGRQHSLADDTRITIGVGGVYRVSGCGSWNPQDADLNDSVLIRKSGRTELCRLQPAEGHDGVVSFNGSVITEVDGGDWLELVIAPRPGRAITARDVTFSVEPMAG